MDTTFERAVDDGERRLTRTGPGLIATGLVGGVDVSFGIFALLVVYEATDNELLAALAFGIGFIALTLANSELFTENFLVPVTAVVARRASVAALGRLWGTTLLFNLVAGWLVIGLVVAGYPRVEAAAVEVASHYSDIGIGWRSLAGALLGGGLITLMTWMERSTDAMVGKLTAAVAAAFLLAAAPLNHVIVVSIEMFAALQVGAPFGYLDWLGVAGWYTVGNLIGGMGMVTALRLVQVGGRKVGREQERGRRSGAGSGKRAA